MEFRLVVIEGRPLGTSIAIKPGQLMIGRDPRCQLRPRSPTVSQLHCRLARRGDEVIVEDLGSSNGTLVNDQFLRPGEEVRLVEGDRLQVGQLIFAFRTSDGSSAPGPQDEGAAAHAGAPPEDDPNEKTLLVSALGRNDHEAVEHLVERKERPPPFVYRDYQVTADAVCIGLSWIQMGDEGKIRSLRKALGKELARSRSRRIILDLGEVEALPSLAIATIVAMAVRCRRAGGGVRLCGVQPGVRRMLATLKLGDVVALHDSYESALSDPWE